MRVVPVVPVDGVGLFRVAAREFVACFRVLLAVVRLVPFEPAAAFLDADFDAVEVFTKRTGFFARDAVVEAGFRFFDEAILKCRDQILKREMLW